jgi:hypothetical protein
MEKEISYFFYFYKLYYFQKVIYMEKLNDMERMRKKTEENYGIELYTKNGVFGCF